MNLSSSSANPLRSGSLTIAPLNSAAYQKNYNTGGRIGYEKIEDARIANIKIYRDGAHASTLALPLASSIRQTGSQ